MIQLIVTVTLLTTLYLIGARKVSRPQPVKVPVRVASPRRTRQRLNLAGVKSNRLAALSLCCQPVVLRCLEN